MEDNLNIKSLRWKYAFLKLKSVWLQNFIIVFGTIWLFAESLSVFFDLIKALIDDYGPLIFLLSIIISIIISFRLIVPKIKIEKSFPASNTKICVKLGNLIEEKGNIAIATSNYFDLQIHKQSSNSVKQQLIHKVFNKDIDLMNRLIEESLESQNIKGKTDMDKSSGKKIQYDIGTTAILPHESRKIFMVVLTKFKTKNSVKYTKSNLTYLHKGLIKLWKTIDSKGNLEELSIPVFGSGLSKISLSRLIFIQLLIMSFVSYARTKRICRKLTIVINEKNYNPTEFLQIKSFLKSIEF